MTVIAQPPDVRREPDLRADGVVLGYGDRLVVEGVDVAVPPGLVTVVVGANACGKSARPHRSSPRSWCWTSSDWRA